MTTTDAKKATDIVVRNPDHPVKATTDTAIDVDIEYKSILGKRSAPKRRKVTLQVENQWTKMKKMVMNN